MGEREGAQVGRQQAAARHGLQVRRQATHDYCSQSTLRRCVGRLCSVWRTQRPAQRTGGGGDSARRGYNRVVTGSEFDVRGYNRLVCVSERSSLCCFFLSAFLQQQPRPPARTRSPGSVQRNVAQRCCMPSTTCEGYKLFTHATHTRRSEHKRKEGACMLMKTRKQFDD
ncbi:hypothetical protein EON67_09540 [archaeon]|nr:MAG: hypothetical protein EON67_09540 [archaeon]